MPLQKMSIGHKKGHNNSLLHLMSEKGLIKATQIRFLTKPMEKKNKWFYINNSANFAHPTGCDKSLQRLGYSSVY